MTTLNAVMVIILYFGYGSGVTTAEYYSMKDCVVAAAVLKAANQRLVITCTEK